MKIEGSPRRGMTRKGRRLWLATLLLLVGDNGFEPLTLCV